MASPPFDDPTAYTLRLAGDHADLARRAARQEHGALGRIVAVREVGDGVFIDAERPEGCLLASVSGKGVPASLAAYLASEVGDALASLGTAPRLHGPATASAVHLGSHGDVRLLAGDEVREGDEAAEVEALVALVRATAASVPEELTELLARFESDSKADVLPRLAGALGRYAVISLEDSPRRALAAWLRSLGSESEEEESPSPADEDAKSHQEGQKDEGGQQEKKPSAADAAPAREGAAEDEEAEASPDAAEASPAEAEASPEDSEAPPDEADVAAQAPEEEEAGSSDEDPAPPAPRKKRRKPPWLTLPLLFAGAGFYIYTLVITPREPTQGWVRIDEESLRGAQVRVGRYYMGSVPLELHLDLGRHQLEVLPEDGPALRAEVEVTTAEAERDRALEPFESSAPAEPVEAAEPQ